MSVPGRSVALAVALYVFCGATVAATAEVRASFQDVSLIGFTRPRAEVRLVAEEAGRFATVDVDVGDTIGSTQRFGCLDSVYVDLDVQANESRQARLRADLEYYTRQAERIGKLVQRSSSAQSELDEFQRLKAGTRAELDEALIRNRELLERKRRHCIEAAENWQVTERLVEPGQWVNAGEAVGTIADFSTLLVPYALSYAEYKALLAASQNLRVRLIDESLEVPATPVHLNPDFDEQTRKISVDLALREAVPHKRGGLRVELVLQLPDPAGAVLVPLSALEQRYEQHWLRREDGSEVPVVYLGRSETPQGTWARVVSSALQPGDRIALP